MNRAIFEESLLPYQFICQTGALKGRCWNLDGEELRIGRSGSCDILLPDAGVSREHCLLLFRNGQLILRDLRSVNGTYVNCESVVETELKPGDEVCVGATWFLVTEREAESPNGQDVPHSDSILLSDTESVLLKEQFDPADFEGRPDTIADLANISMLGRELSYARTRNEIQKTLTKRLRRHASLLAIHLLDMATIPPSEERLFCRKMYEPLPAETRQRIATKAWQEDSSGSGILDAIPRDPDPVWLAAAPMKIAGKVVGAIVVELEADAVRAPDRMLDFFMAAAATVAPFFHALERLDSLRSENARLSRASSQEPIMVGESAAMLRLKEQVKRAAETDLNVLITGETGTGKELVAKLLHAQSPRKGGKLVPINCAAIPHELFISELFGHEKGGFTGADSRRAGFADLADGGTLFLDEITELGPQNQAALLRFLESKSYYPVGGSEERRSDTRVVAATNRDLGALAQEKTLRDDLYHRLSTIHIHVPPLRERVEDIPALAEFFYNQALRNARRPLLGFSEDATEFLCRQPWTGNARELRNLVERAVAFANHEQIATEDLRRHTSADDGDGLVHPGAMNVSLEDLERRHIESVFQSCGQNVRAACEVLGIGKTTLYDKLAKYGLKPKREEVDADSGNRT